MTVDVFFPDRSQFQGRTISHELVVCARASEGNWLSDPEYGWNVTEAHAIGARQFAYHFLEDGSSAASQAAWCHAITGQAPLMLDLEPILGLGAAHPAGPIDGQGHYCGQAWRDLMAWGAGAGHVTGPVTGAVLQDLITGASYVSRPGIVLAEAFIDAYRARGGICHNLYLPRWYWQALGSPDLAGMRARGMFLTSSIYTAYSDTGAGWAGYGGMVPEVWQYTDAGPWSMDWNAIKGSASSTSTADTVGELWALLTTGSRAAPAPPPARKLVNLVPKTGQSLHQLIRAHPGNVVAGALVRSITKWPRQWAEQPQRAYLNAGDWDKPLPSGTWFALWQ